MALRFQVGDYVSLDHIPACFTLTSFLSARLCAGQNYIAYDPYQDVIKSAVIDKILFGSVWCYNVEVTVEERLPANSNKNPSSHSFLIYVDDYELEFDVTRIARNGQISNVQVSIGGTPITGMGSTNTTSLPMSKFSIGDKVKLSPSADIYSIQRRVGVANIYLTRFDIREIIITKDFKNTAAAFNLTKNVYGAIITTRNNGTFRDIPLEEDEIELDSSSYYQAVSAVNMIATVSCYHPKKYKNSAGGKTFYVCPDCKADLGDVE